MEKAEMSDLVGAIANAIAEQRAAEYGGCFKSTVLEHWPNSEDDCIDGKCWCAVILKCHAQAALRAITSAGYAIVPVEPTEAMKAAGRDAAIRGGEPDFPGDVHPTTHYYAIDAEEAGCVWTAMMGAKDDG